jgi:altronate hydrolase
MRLVRCQDADSVAVALEDLARGDGVSGVGAAIALRDPIPRGHKLALRRHSRGDPVIKYGEVIGIATAPIEPGEHVHSHNLATALKGEVDYGNRPAAPEPVAAAPLGPWQGYRRADGNIGSLDSRAKG